MQCRCKGDNGSAALMVRLGADEGRQAGLLLKWSGRVGSAVAGSWPGCEEEGLSRAFTSPFSLSTSQLGTVTCTLCT